MKVSSPCRTDLPSEELPDEVKADRRETLKAALAGLAVLAAGSVHPLVARAARRAARSPAKRHYAMVIDLRRCIGCRGCTVACKSEFGDAIGVFRSCVQERDLGKYPKTRRRFVPVLCNHCSAPPCVEACPVDPVEATFEWPDDSTTTYERRATYKRPDGPVLVDEKRCISCGACIEACPYGARFYNPHAEAGGSPGEHAIGKCTLCVHRVGEGLVPSCVQTCLGRARIFGDLSDPDSEVSQLLRANKTRVLLPRKGAEPNVFYIGLEDDAYRSYGDEEGFRDEIG
ncbi:MAG: 4Fe-4S dicluster domain-containing protein [Candidatus Krumholzibacteriia bacterium]